MSSNLKKNPGFDEIVFEIRNKEYGAYQLRKKYNRNLLLALIIGSLLMSTAVVTPFITATADGPGHEYIPINGDVTFDRYNTPVDPVAPPPPPPMVPDNMQQQVVYTAPVIVDSIKPGEEMRLLTFEEAGKVIKDLRAVEVIKADTLIIPELTEEPEPRVSVSEMPMFPGGNAALLQYIAENVAYPEIARQNNVQGKVVVKFCVTASGVIDRVSILKGVDQALDNEAIRVVETFPEFIPGKQDGKPVPVWYIVPINFQLK